MRSTNSKPKPFSQFPMDKIKLRPSFFLVQEVATRIKIIIGKKGRFISTLSRYNGQHLELDVKGNKIAMLAVQEFNH